jgi:hypothetical protein
MGLGQKEDIISGESKIACFPIACPHKNTMVSRTANHVELKEATRKKYLPMATSITCALNSLLALKDKFLWVE